MDGGRCRLTGKATGNCFPAEHHLHCAFPVDSPRFFWYFSFSQEGALALAQPYENVLPRPCCLWKHPSLTQGQACRAPFADKNSSTSTWKSTWISIMKKAAIFINFPGEFDGFEQFQKDQWLSKNFFPQKSYGCYGWAMKSDQLEAIKWSYRTRIPIILIMSILLFF